MRPRHILCTRKELVASEVGPGSPGCHGLPKAVQGGPTNRLQAAGTGTWRIIPVSKWLITMVSKSPNWGYSPYKWPKWLIIGGY